MATGCAETTYTQYTVRASAVINVHISITHRIHQKNPLTPHSKGSLCQLQHSSAVSLSGGAKYADFQVLK